MEPYFISHRNKCQIDQRLENETIKILGECAKQFKNNIGVGKGWQKSNISSLQNNPEAQISKVNNTSEKKCLKHLFLAFKKKWPKDITQLIWWITNWSETDENVLNVIQNLKNRNRLYWDIILHYEIVRDKMFQSRLCWPRKLVFLHIDCESSH